VGLLTQRDRLERGDWRNWNFARSRARRLLHDQEARLQTLPCPRTTPESSKPSD